jgi:hypothetical protein
MTTEQLNKMVAASQNRTVTMRFTAKETCSFLLERERKIEPDTKHVSQLKIGAAPTISFTSKVVTIVKEYVWRFDVTYELIMFPGADEETDRVVLRSRSATQEIVTSVKANPRKESTIYPPIDVDVTWFLSRIASTRAQTKDSAGGNDVSPMDGVVDFIVDRTSAKCHTPRRNPDVEGALTRICNLSWWANSVSSYFRDHLFPVVTEHGFDLASLSDAGVFVPVIPLFEEGGSSVHAYHLVENPEASSQVITSAIRAPFEVGQILEATTTTAVTASTQSAGASSAALVASAVSPASTAMLAVADSNAFLAEECRSLQEKSEKLAETFPPASAPGVITVAEGMTLVVLGHMRSVYEQLQLSLDYVEDMLRKQLVAAIGKVVTPADFSGYMRFHNRKLFREAFQPRAFCYAVRRSAAHSPEGTVSIEEQLNDGSIASPIDTIVSSSAEGGFVSAPMEFSLSASTTVRFGGERCLHAWLSHRFSGASASTLSLVSRARQFSSYIVLIGRIASAKLFQPKHALIVMNKDEVTVPLDLETIPTPKEFRDAIESLSPEQQRFAKAYRSMQLESTLFGVCVIQIKPQLELLLKLSPDSLTKEIALTESLMELFIKYQIPSDLLSFDGAEGADSSSRVARVRRNVDAMYEMIRKAEEKEIQDRRKEEEYKQPMREVEREKSLQRSLQSAGLEGFSPPGGGGGKGGGRGGSMRRTESSHPPIYAMGMAMCSVPMAPMPPPCPSGAGAVPPSFQQQSVAISPPVSTPAPAPAPAPAQVERNQIADAPMDGGEIFTPSVVEDTIDFTKIPSQLDQKFEALDPDSALRPTIINPGASWTKRAQKALLSSPTTSTLSTGDQKQERDRAFDLLDALSRSGGLPMEHATLHVVLAATHCFDKSLLETVVQDNVNPIEKVERSSLIMGTTVHRCAASELIREDQLARVETYSPMLFIEN